MAEQTPEGQAEAVALSDSYCKGCRDEPGGCERCNPAREERARQLALAKADRAVLDAMANAPSDWLLWWAETGGGAGPEGWMKPLAVAELARRGLK
jgi:hypothetical protein